MRVFDAHPLTRRISHDLTTVACGVINAELRDRLAAIEEELAEAALAKLRSAVDGDTDAAKEERRITRARRAVAKAIQVLDGGMNDDLDDF